MHRINQSRRKLTASIAAAAKAEDELLEAAASSSAVASAAAGGIQLPPSAGDKRQFKDVLDGERDPCVNSKQRIEKIDSDNDDQGILSSIPSSPTHKKAAILRSPEVTSSPSPSSPPPPSSSILIAQISAISTIPVSTITPTNGNASDPSTTSNSTPIASTAAAEPAIATTNAASPDRTMMAIDLTSQSPPLDNEVSVVHPPPPMPISINSETTTKDKRDNNNDDEEEEIQVVSSTTINPNIQYPHKRTDCGLYHFSVDPKKFCEKCYCVVCDIPAKDCAKWEDHCVQIQRGIHNDSDSLVALVPTETTTNPSAPAVAMDIDDEDSEEDIQVVSSTTINPNIQYPHKRTDCGVFSFSTDPKKFCDKCYCVVCDIPAKDCTNWGNHSIEKCRPATSLEDAMTDEDEGYDVTDEILLESPSTTATDHYNRQRRLSLEQERAVEEGEECYRQHGSWLPENDAKLKILEVLSRKLKSALQISEGGRMPMLENRGKSKKKDAKQQPKNAMEGDIPQLGLHSAFFVEGIKIGWPFPAIMLPQRQMAIHIIKGLKRKLHVVLESPTGTGKSVAILCSVLAWQRYHMQTRAHAQQAGSDPSDDEEKRLPKIIYCSRTHSQVAQMVSSLKKTPYRPTMTILGSRERLCVHKKLTGKNKKKNKIPINLACQSRRLNTEFDRKRRLKKFEYNDDNPRPHDDYDGDDIAENDIEFDGKSTSATDENGAIRIPRKPRPTCPHYRQLSSEWVASVTAKRFTGGHRLKGNSRGECCGGSSAVGGEESAFGVHDMEDLVRFGKNPYKEENIAVYRGKTGKFGFLVNNNVNERDNITKGCHVVSLVSGGAAEFEARLQDGDKILKVNGIDVRTWNKARIVELLGRTPKDQPARLNVLRANSDTSELLDPEKDLMGTQDTDHPEDIYSDRSVCPYYVSRAIQAHAELTFAPYNYILDPGIRRVMNISLKNAVVVLDEAHNVESTLREGGSGKYGEMDLFQLVCTLGNYARRTTSTGSITLISTQEKIDSAKLAHHLLLFVENIISHMQALRQKFETSPGREKLESDYKRYHNTPDNHEVELSYDGPTGYGIKGAAVGCQPFLTRLGITKEKCSQLLELALSMEQKLFGGNSESDDTDQTDNVTGDSSNVLTVLVEMLSKLVTATENPEHYYISCVVQANGNLDHAFGIEDENNNGRAESRRFKKKPRMVPFMSPRSPKSPRAFLPLCQHKECNPTQIFTGTGVQHGSYCDGSTPAWECHLVLHLLSPGLLMREISQECRSVILASGSLAPLPSVCAELNLFGNDSSSTTDNQKSIITGNKLPTISQSLLDSFVKGRAEKLYTNRLQNTPKPLEANHVVNLQKQLLAVSIGHFPNGEKLTVSYTNYHKNPSFLPKFGHAVASVIDGVPKGGCLVFFPSYSFLKKCVSCWNQQSLEDNNNNNYSYSNHRRRGGTSQENSFVWDRFLRSKGKVIVEPTGSQEDFEHARDEYREIIRTTGSCILLAVFRGKMSEGIDFNDENARAVICIGMPLPNWTDRSVKAKQAYNDEQRKLRNKTCLLPGRDFYSQQAHRAIAQALGRCIRHGADYGTVILMDSRHCHDGSPLTSGGVCRAHSNLPKWMRGSVQTLSMEHEDRGRRIQHNSGNQPKMLYGGYAGLKREMRQFFARAPVASREVLDKWKADRERALSASSGGSSNNVVFHRGTGNWKTSVQI